ncbi:MAG: endonuclease/exonuclease/phosphatase family protein [Actinomycetota bacterium]
MVGSSSIHTGPGRKFLSALLFAVGAIATLATIAGFFGGRWWGFDGVADWRLSLFVLLTVTSIIYGLVFRRALSAVFLLAAVVNAVLLAPMWLSTQADVSSSDRIRLATFDAGGPGDYRRATIEWIDGEEADVAVIFNTDGWWVDTLSITGAPYTIIGQPDDERTIGTLVLARSGTSVSMTPTVEGTDVTLRVVNGSQTLTVIGLAEHRPDSSGEADRRLERFASVNAAAIAADGPIVVAGNLNTSRWSNAFAQLSEGLVNSENGFGYAATWPPLTWPIVGSYVGLPLDHALYAGDITVPRRKVGPDLGAERLPLVFDVAPADA